VKRIRKLLRALVGMPLFIAAVGLPLVTIAIVRDRVDAALPTTEAIADKPILAAPGVTEIDFRRPANFRASFSEPLEVRAGPVHGLVTEVFVARGDALRSGDTALLVDGVVRVFAVTHAPFWRPIGLNATGSDVETAERLMSSLGYDMDTDSKLSYSELLEVARFGESLGVAGHIGQLEPSWFVWVPSTAFIVGDVGVSVGDRLAAYESVLVRSRAELTSVDVSSNDGSSLHLDASLQWTGSINGFDFDILADDVGGVRVAYRAPLSTQVSFDSTTGFAAGVVFAADPVTVYALPPAALLASESGSGGCVVVTDSVGMQARAVETVVGPPGSVLVSSGLDKSDRVVVNPRDAALAFLCN